MKYIIKFSLIFTLCIHSAYANMILNKSIIYFEEGSPNQQDVEIENVGTTPLYIKVTPHIVRNPGTENQIREPYDDPTQAGLLVSPNKLVVKAGSRKLVRFVNLNRHSNEESVYRVSVTPVVGDLEGKQTGVKIVIGYEVLVLVSPANSQPVLVHSRQGKTLNIKNNGTRNILLREGIQCLPGITDENECDHISGKRLYPGNSWSVELPHDMPVKYYLTTGTQNSVMEFD